MISCIALYSPAVQSQVAVAQRFSPEFARERLARLRSRMNVELVKKFIHPRSGKLTVVPPPINVLADIAYTVKSGRIPLCGLGGEFGRAGSFGRVSDPIGSEGACNESLMVQVLRWPNFSQSI